MLTEQSFWGRVQKRPNECWIWLGKKNAHGYGQVYVGGGRCNGKREVAHRIAWRFTFGPIPEGLFVCRHCDNPSCVNPQHLFVGTMKDNIRDASSKRRLGVQRYPERYKDSIRKATLASLEKRKYANWVSPGRTGQPHTDETKKKISEARKRSIEAAKVGAL